MEKEIELLPCPFCDGEAEMFEPIQSNAVNVTSFVRCSSDSCEIKTDLYNTTKEAINKWNTRTATAREARLVEALEHYADAAHWSQIRNNNGNGEFLPVRYSDGNNPNAHGRDVAAIALNENIVRCSHGFDVLNDAGETIGHFDTAAEALAEYRGERSLDDQIASGTKSWDSVDTDKFIDNLRGRQG